jgi:hypothetical protein
MLAVLLQTRGGGGGVGVLVILAVLVGLFLTLNAIWKRDKRLKSARDKALANRLLKRIYERPGDPVNVAALARQERLPESVVKQICEGKLVGEGYLQRKKRPKIDRQERLFLSPSGVEAMQRRADKTL